MNMLEVMIDQSFTGNVATGVVFKRVRARWKTTELSSFLAKKEKIGLKHNPKNFRVMSTIDNTIKKTKIIFLNKCIRKVWVLCIK